jgi:hypothetical protein
MIRVPPAEKIFILSVFSRDQAGLRAQNKHLQPRAIIFNL